MSAEVEVCDADYNRSTVKVTGGNLPSLRRWKDPVTLDSTSLMSLSEFANRGGSRQHASWVRVFPSGRRQHLMQERTYIPYSFFKQISSEYWLTYVYFDRPQRAVKYLVAAGVTLANWCIQRHFYGPGYFLISGDFDDALKFLGYRYSDAGESPDLTEDEADRIGSMSRQLIRELRAVAR